MAPNTDGTALIKQFTDHLLLFGSTGLVGSLTLKELREIDFQICNTRDIQKKIDSCQHPEVAEFRFDKFLYCINRKIRQPSVPDDQYHVEKHRVDALRYNEESYFIDRIERLKGTAVSENSSTGLNATVSQTIHVGEDCVDEILNYHVDKQRYLAEYASETLKKISLTFTIYVIQIATLDSRKWPTLLPLIFSGCVSLSAEAPADSAKLRLPPLDEIPTMICALGANSSAPTNKSPGRNYVDRELTLKLVQAFNNCEGKRLVIITTFNNVLISHIFPYFRTKSKLEYDLQCKLSSKLGHLVLLRPGPLVADHADIAERRMTIRSSSNILKQVLYYKQCCFQCKLLLFKECKRTGLKTKASEIIARSMYRRPGSWILGYCLPASKVAHTAALKAVEPPVDKAKHLIETITSEEMDKKFARWA